MRESTAVKLKVYWGALTLQLHSLYSVSRLGRFHKEIKQESYLSTITSAALVINFRKYKVKVYRTGF